MEEKSFKELLHTVTTFVFDVDGVFTDGSLFLDDKGGLLRTMNVKDGYAVKFALNKGYNIAVISAGQNETVKQRLQGLGIQDVYLNASDKVTCLNEIIAKYQLTKEQIVYMGDDLLDIPAMKCVGMPTCPQDAVPEVKAHARYISHKKGGKTCVRDIIEQVLKVRGDWLVF